ncbi:MAG: V-type ATP synthase subunit D [Methylococcales bacterium]
MARLQLSKSSLSRETTDLKTYRQFLPSLDLKRQELMTRRAKAKKILEQTKIDIDSKMKEIGEKLPMLSNDKVDLKGLVVVKAVLLEEENVMGAYLPVLKDVQIETRDYSFLVKPHWVDDAAAKLREMSTLKIRIQVEQRRLELLNEAVRKITQRVNLFDKVLIPRTRENIKRIKIYLSDAERAAVINAKLAKNKRLREAEL